MTPSDQALLNPPGLYFWLLCTAAPLVSLTGDASWFVFVGPFIIAAVGWVAFTGSARMTNNIYLHALLGAAICTALLYLLETWTAAQLRRTLRLDGAYIFVRGKITNEGVWEIILYVGKFALAFAIVVVVCKWLEAKIRSREAD